MMIDDGLYIFKVKIDQQLIREPYVFQIV